MKPPVSRAMSRRVKLSRGWNNVSVDSESIDVSTLDQKFNPFLLPMRIADKNVYRPVPRQLSKALRLKRVSSQRLKETRADHGEGPSTPTHDELTRHADRGDSSGRPLDTALEKIAQKKKKNTDAKIKRRMESRKETMNAIKCPQSHSRQDDTADATPSSLASLTAAEVAKHSNKVSAETLIETDLRPGVLQRVVRSFKSRKTTPNVRVEVTDSVTEGETPARTAHGKAPSGAPSQAIHKEADSGCSLETEDTQGSFGGSNDLVKLDCGASWMPTPEAWPQGPILDLESSANFCASPETYGIMDDVGNAFYKTMSRLAVYPAPIQPIYHHSHNTTTSRSHKNVAINDANNVDFPEGRDDETALIRPINRETDDCRDPACAERRDQSLTDTGLGGATVDGGCFSDDENERSPPVPENTVERETGRSLQHHSNKSGSSKEPSATDNGDTFRDSYLLGYLLGILALQRNPKYSGRQSTDQKCSRLVFIHESDQEIELEAINVRHEQHDRGISLSDLDGTARAMEDQTQTSLNSGPSSPRSTQDVERVDSVGLNEDKVSVSKSTTIRPLTFSDASLVFSAATPIEEIVQMVQTHRTPHFAKGFLVYILTKFLKQAKSVHHGGLHMGFARCLSESAVFTDSGPDPKSLSDYSSLPSFAKEKPASSMLSEIVRYALSLASASYNGGCHRLSGARSHDRETIHKTDADLESILISVASSLTRISQRPRIRLRQKGDTGPAMMSDLSLSSGTCESWSSNGNSGSNSLSYNSNDADEDDSDDEDDDGVSSASSSSSGGDWLGILASSYDSMSASDNSAYERMLSFDVTELMLRE